VLVEGRYVTIPSGSFTVAEACSGINYLIATLSVGTMFAYLQFRSYWRRALFMVVALIVPLVANGIRAFGIVMISHLSNYTLAQGVDHFIYGWVFFGFVIFILFWVGRSFSDVDQPLTPTAAVTPVTATPFSAVRATTMLVLALLAGFGPRAALEAADSKRPIADEIALHAVPGWRGPETVSPLLGSHFAGADQHLSGRYVASDGSEVSVEIDYYRQQGDDGELINQNNRVFDAGAWRQLAHNLRSMAEGAPLARVNELQLRHKSEKEYLLWYWYDAQGELSSDNFPSKLAEGRARLRGSNVGSAMVAIRASLDNGPDAAAASLRVFLGTGAVLIKNLRAHP
jgi:EpsI family protein